MSSTAMPANNRFSTAYTTLRQEHQHPHAIKPQDRLLKLFSATTILKFSPFTSLLILPPAFLYSPHLTSSSNHGIEPAIRKVYARQLDAQPARHVAEQDGRGPAQYADGGPSSAL